MTEGRIFINYRRDDSRADSGRLYDRLVSRFPGKVFRDVASLEPGVEWHDAINRVLSQSDACIVVIGSNWLNIKDASGRRRLDDPNDTVRQEVLTALIRQMRVLPVLVGGAKMPSAEDLPVELQALCRRNALEITEQDWDENLAKLIKALEVVFGPGPSPPPVNRGSAFKKWGLAVVGAMAALFLLVAYLGKPKLPDPVKPDQPNPPIHQTGDLPPENHPSPAPDIPIEPPRRPVPTAPHVVGNWDAVVSGGGQQANELIEFYGDNSFMIRGGVVAVGRWRYNPGSGSLETNATNLLTSVKFACAWKSVSSGQFSGGCQDGLRGSSVVSLTHREGSLPEPPNSVPRVNLSSLTMAERAAFAQRLATMRCTCNCRMTVLVCLEKDRTCQYSPNLAQNALANFLRITRG
jgi:hypothetical protein